MERNEIKSINDIDNKYLKKKLKCLSRNDILKIQSTWSQLLYICKIQNIEFSEKLFEL